MLRFYKLSGCGNDFIAIDNRNNNYTEEDKAQLAANLCKRGRSLGADGMLFIECSSVGDVGMDYYNADGSKGEMCGNGLRCFAALCHHLDICAPAMMVETGAGLYQAELRGNGAVRIRMPPVDLPRLNIRPDPALPELHTLTVGVPHAIVYAPGSFQWPRERVEELGRQIRRHHHFPKGTNVNFLCLEQGLIRVRTYERGVEAETLACGTGATASALAAAITDRYSSPVRVLMLGGELLVGFKQEQRRFTEVWLQGQALLVARGEIYPGAFNKK